MQDLQTDSDSPVTAMATELNSLSLLASGFGDGMVKIFDKRLEEDEAVVHLCGGHASWVQNVCWSPTHGKQFLSARSVLPFRYPEVRISRR